MRFHACVAFALLIATPVLAQDGVDETPYADQRPRSEEAQAAQQQAGACVQLMQRAFYLPDPANLERAMDAHHEMEMARDAYRRGDEFACTRHAIHALEDRT